MYGIRFTDAFDGKDREFTLDGYPLDQGEGGEVFEVVFMGTGEVVNIDQVKLCGGGRLLPFAEGTLPKLERHSRFTKCPGWKYFSFSVADDVVDDTIKLSIRQVMEYLKFGMKSFTKGKRNGMPHLQVKLECGPAVLKAFTQVVRPPLLHLLPRSPDPNTSTKSANHSN